MIRVPKLNVTDLLTAGVKVIGTHEGFRAMKYKDTKGIWSIGYGFNLESGTFTPAQVEKWKTKGITVAEADAVLATHIQKTLAYLNKIGWFKELDLPRQLAILDMTYNMGNGWIDRWSNTVGFIRAKSYFVAARAIARSAYAKQVGLRAKRNYFALVEGYYPDLSANATAILKTYEV